jgi:hypothetical protein
LLPGLPRTWRGLHTLQLGADPARSVLLDLPDPRAADLLDLLDGSRPERVILRRASGLGISAAEIRALLDTLHTAGLLLPASRLLPPALPDECRRRLTGEAAALALGGVPAPARPLRRRVAARVVVRGSGRLGAAVAVALVQAGVGHVHADLPGTVTAAELPGGPLHGADVGTPRSAAVTAALLRAAPTAETRSVRRGTASLVVQLGHEQPAALLAAGHLRRRQPHLALAVHDGVAVVGPFVPATGAPCLNCVDLHRRERDPEWPGHPAGSPATVEPCTVTTLLAATAYATAEALTFLDGGTPETTGAAVEITAPGRFRRRTWPPHPACGCGPRPRTRSLAGNHLSAAGRGPAPLPAAAALTRRARETRCPPPPAGPPESVANSRPETAAGQPSSHCGMGCNAPR